MAISHLAIVAATPVWGTSAEYPKRIEISTYTHAISADGGYMSCSFSVGGGRENAEDWIFAYLGNDIKVYNESNVLIWRGFVNSISVSLGTLSLTRGPMIDVGNKVSIAYQTPSYTIDGVTIGGNQQVTAAVNDLESQERYGIRRKILSGGTASTTEAGQILNTYLSESKEPPLNNTVAIGGQSGNVSIQVDCLGYVELLDYIPQSIAANGTMDLSSKIAVVMGLDPDNIFSTDYSKISSNTTQVSQYWEGDKTALETIRSLVSVGDSNYSRYIWGIYDNLQMRYEAIPTAYEYIHRLSSRDQGVEDLNGNTVLPWNVLPGKFMLVSDFLVGRAIPDSDFRVDPRMMFIESVQYTAPWDVSLSGGKTGTLNQKLERLNLREM